MVIYFKIIQTPYIFRLNEYMDYLKTEAPTWITKGYGQLIISTILRNWERKGPIWVVMLLNLLDKSYFSTGEPELLANSFEVNPIAPILDVYLMNKAKYGKITLEIENAEEQCLAFNGINSTLVSV